MKIILPILFLTVLFVCSETVKASAFLFAQANAGGLQDDISVGSQAATSVSGSVSQLGGGGGASASGYGSLASVSIGVQAAANCPTCTALIQVNILDTLIFPASSAGYVVQFNLHGSGTASGVFAAVASMTGPQPIFISVSCTNGCDQTVTGFRFIPPAGAMVDVGLNARIELTEPGSANFFNTFSGSVITPAGINFTSVSGVFGTQPPGNVPEPTTMLLLGTGLAGIVIKVRKRRKAV